MNNQNLSPAEVLKLSHIGKSFGPTRALDDVTLGICEGEIHAILGQNGAGKSTLVNIMDSSMELATSENVDDLIAIWEDSGF